MTTVPCNRPTSSTEPERLLAETRQLINAGELTDREAGRIVPQAVDRFWGQYLGDRSYPREVITLLCELAVQPDPLVARVAQDAIFSSLVEQSSDAFDPEYCTLYDQVFSQIIDWCRRQPDGGALDRALTEFGLRSEQDIMERSLRLGGSHPHFLGDPSNIRRVLIPSRVTLGAEVAVTATLIARMRHVFEHAEFTIMASPAIRQLFAGDRRVSVREVHYSRGRGLLHQFQSWFDVMNIIKDETRGLAYGQFIVVDPDSRLTQLGLLPILQDESGYFFFPSRSRGGEGTESVGTLANLWANEVLGEDKVVFPQLSLSGPDRDFAATLYRQLRGTGEDDVVVMNFGVGGNTAKRLSETFEFELVLQLADSGSRIVLAKGIGEEEIARTDRLLARVESSGKTVREVNSPLSSSIPPERPVQADILAWQGSVGIYCALIEQSDEYVGYDSGGQHIAAALGTPAIDIFAHSPYPRFIQRWRPYGPGAVHIVDATGQHLSKSSDYRPIVDQILDCHRSR